MTRGFWHLTKLGDPWNYAYSHWLKTLIVNLQKYRDLDTFPKNDVISFFRNVFVLQD